jgi:hypothetical protein
MANRALRGMPPVTAGGTGYQKIRAVKHHPLPCSRLRASIRKRRE